MKDWIKIILIDCAVAVGVVFLFIGYGVFDIWLSVNYKSHLQTLYHPQSGSKFILMTDTAGFDSDPEWYVYQLPENSPINSSMKEGQNVEGVLFSNYAEAGYHSYNPVIFITRNKYLVFSRSNFFHSLYDIEKKKVLVNEMVPWSAAGNPSSRDRKKAKKIMDEWVRENLHSRIEKIISEGS